MIPELFTLEQARDYVRKMGRKRMTFYYNVYGWSAYYTLQPTFATPTGKLRDFQRTKRISI